MRTWTWSLFLFCVTALLVPAPAATAQITVTPTPLLIRANATAAPQERLTFRVPKTWSVLDDLTKSYNTGNWIELQTRAAQWLHALSCEEYFTFELPTGSPCGTDGRRRGFNLRADYVLLVWTGSDAGGKPAIRRVIIHEPAVEPFTSRLPGLPNARSRAYEMFVSEQTAAGHAAAYVFTKVDDPVSAQIPAFLTGLQGPLFQLASAVLGTAQVEQQQRFRNMSAAEQRALTEDTTKPVSIWLRHLVPPNKRASVAVKDVVALPVTGAALKGSVGNITTRLRVLDAGTFTCARDYAVKVGDSLSSEATAPLCREDATASACFEQLEGAINGVTASCTGEAESRVAQKVSEGFRKWLLDVRGSELTLDSAMTNEPRRHVSFGALTSVALSLTLSEERVELNDDGVIIADPLGRQLSMAVVNFSPRGYDPSASRPQWAERLQPFVGAVLLPEFGVSTGVTMTIWRGIGVNAGLAVLAVPTLGQGEQLGAPASDARDPLGLGWARATFVGFSYTFGAK